MSFEEWFLSARGFSHDFLGGDGMVVNAMREAYEAGQNTPPREAKVQGYLDGYKAAADAASTVRLKVCAEVDPAIALGVNAVSTLLKSQYELLVKSES